MNPKFGRRLVRHLRTPSVLHESAWNAAAWIALAILSFSSSALIFRFTGQASYGIWATVVSLRTFMMFLDAGLVLGVARDAARTDVEAGTARKRLAASRATYACIGAVVAFIGLVGSDLPGALLGISGDDRVTARLVTAILSLDAGLALVASPLAGMLRGRRRFHILAIGSSIQTVVGVALILGLTPALGLPGAALALLVARGFPTIGYLIWLRRNEPTLFGGEAAGSYKTVIRFAIPVWIVTLGTQLGVGMDVPIVGAFYGPSHASAYALGSLLPSIAAGLLFVIIDATYPRLAASSSVGLAEQIPRLMLIGTTLGVVGFGVLVLNARAVITTWVGTAPDLSISVLAIYAISRVINIPTHILSMAAIARDRHSLLAPIVLAEALASVGLGVTLAAAWSPLGPAVATLATISVSNLVVIPVLLLRQLHIRPGRIVSRALLGVIIGVPAAVVITSAAALFSQAIVRVLVASVFTVGAAGILAAVTVLGRDMGIVGLLRRGGHRIIIREFRERAAARQRLEAIRAIPYVWERSEPPLVSVRIATYNRGRIVAERAIASALRQTHRRIEVVVVGDHCDAETERAVRSVRDPRVRFENLAARGSYPNDPELRWMVAGTAPMNRALQLVRGDWIAPLDDDDEFTDDHVEVLLDACRTRDLELAYGIADMEREDGRWEQVGSWPMRRRHIVHAAVLYSRSLSFFQHCEESWRLREPADWNLWRRMRSAGVRIGFVPTVVCRHFKERRDVPTP